jgi:hypothetical protein
MAAVAIIILVCLLALAWSYMRLYRKYKRERAKRVEFERKYFSQQYEIDLAKMKSEASEEFGDKYLHFHKLYVDLLQELYNDYKRLSKHGTKWDFKLAMIRICSAVARGEIKGEFFLTPNGEKIYLCFCDEKTHKVKCFLKTWNKGSSTLDDDCLELSRLFHKFNIPFIIDDNNGDARILL